MAEEINTSEQDLGAPDIDLTQKSDPVAFADAVIQNLPSSVNLPAKPEAFDIYDKAVGNPLTGPPKLTTNGGLSNAAQVDALMDKAFKQIAVQDNPYSSLRPYTYSGDYDASNFDRYYSTEDVYSKLGFNPYRNNEALYNNKMTFGDQFSRAASQWDNLVATGFMSGVRSWGDMFTDPLAPDIKAARDMERYMAIGSSSTGGVGGFVTNTFLNSGYSIGIGLEFLAEELALMGVTAVTGGLTSEITAPLMVSRGTSAINKLIKGGKAATKMDGVRAVTNSLDDARSFWNTIGGKVAQGVFDIANPLDNTIKTLKATDYATDFASVSKTFGAFADDMLQIKQSVGEAKIEAGSTKLEVTEQLIQKYRDENGGEDPDEKELAKIDAIASQAAYKTAVWNLPAIMTSNKLMNATILAPLRKVMGNQTTKLVDDYIFSNKTFSKVGDGFLSQTKAAVKSLAKPKFYGQFGMNYLKANIAEGVQENLQEAIAIGAVEHAKALYTDPIRANYEGFMGNFLHGVKDQFSAEGAETFASGLLMGAFSQPVMAAPSVAISKLIKAAQTGDKYKALKALRDEQDKRNVNYLNETYQDALKFFAPDIANASRTGKLAKDMYTAARMGDKNGTLNNRDAIANHHIITALRTGKFDIMMDRLKEYKKFNDQEIVEAFKKHGVEEQDVKKAAAMIDDVIARAEGIRNNYEQIANKYPNPFNPAKFRDGTPEKKAAQIAKAAWDEATHNVLFAGATFESHSKRIEDIAKTFSKVSNTLAGQDAQSLMNLLSSQGTINEINVLRKEVAVLDDTLPDQKTLKVEKQKQLDAISNYYDAIGSIKFARTDEERAEAEKKAKEAFGEYVRVLGKKNGKIIFNEALEEAYTLTKDSLLLKNDMDGLAQSLNVLMTPDNFFNLHTALNTSMTEAFDNKVDIISLNQEQFRTYQDINGVVEEITKESGLYLSEELISTLAQLKQKGIVIPEMPAFVDKEGNRVTSGPAYDKAKAIWDAYVKVARSGDIETIKSNYDPKALSTYPQGLIDLLREQYNKLDEDTKSNISFEDWAIGDDQEKTRTRYFKYLYKSDFSSIDEKYKSMTLEELNDAITKLNQELEGKEPAAVSEDVEKQKADLRYSIQQLENDLANRIDALVKNGATLEEATKIGTKEFDESEGGKNRVALDKLKADLAALEQPIDTEAKVIPKKVKGASGWKLRFNIKATTDQDYKAKAKKLSEWLDNYFGTTKRQEQKGDGYFAFKEGSSSSVWKHLAGGDKGESDFTIYIGSKEDAIKFAKQVEESEIKDLITIGTMGEDTLIGNIVKGRFDSKEFKYLVPNINILKKSLEEEGLSKNGEFVTQTKSGIKIVVTDGKIIYSTDGGKTFKDYKSSILSDTKNAVEVRDQIIEDIYGDDYTGNNIKAAALEGKPEEKPTEKKAEEKPKEVKPAEKEVVEGELPLDAKGRKVGNKEYKSGKNHVFGRSITRTAPNGTKIKGKYKLVPASELVPSHNPNSFAKNEEFPQTKEGKTINDRDYEKDKPAQGQVKNIAQNFSAAALDQSPVVSKEGIVYDGNNRTMSRQLAAQNNTDEEYLDELKERAEMYGFTAEDVDSIKNPTLVFEVEENLPFDTKTMAMFNVAEKKAQSPIQRAIAINKRLSDKAKVLLSNLYEQVDTPSEVTSNPKMMKEAVDILVAEGVIDSKEIPRYVNESGTATTDGTSFLEGVVMAATLNEDSIQAISSDGMGDIKKMILSNIVGLMQNSAKGKDSLINEIAGAIQIMQKAKSLKISVTDFLSQIDVFNENNFTLGEMSMALLLNTKKPNELKGFLRNYNQDVGVESLFGEDTSKQAILDRLLNSIIQNYEKVKENIRAIAGGRIDSARRSGEQAEPTSEDVAEQKAKSIKSIFDESVKLFYKIRGTEGAAKKRNLTQERKELLKENPTVRFIDNNISSIFEQLENKNIIKRKGNCP